MSVKEEIVNHIIAKLLEEVGKELGLVCKAERTLSGKRPDIRCFFNGLRIGIESSYNGKDAENDARDRLNQGLVDVAIALWIKEDFGNLTESEVEDRVKRAKFDVKVLIPFKTPRAVTDSLKNKLGVVSVTTSDWITDVDLLSLKTIIQDLPRELMTETEAEEYIERVSSVLKDFSQMVDDEIAELLYNSLWRLYGMQTVKDREIIATQAGLLIILACAFHEHLRNLNPKLPRLDDLMAHNHSSLLAIRIAMQDIEKIDYQLITKNTREIVSILPPKFNLIVQFLLDEGIKLAQNNVLLSRDIAGRIFHRVSGDITQRKGFATYYTQIPAAMLLAGLCAYTLFDNPNFVEMGEKEVQSLLKRISEVKIADFACGSGTLLTSAYQWLMRFVNTIVYYCGVKQDTKSVARSILENVYGIDALKYAAQITAINLALLAPDVKRQNIRADYLGVKPENAKKEVVWLGSLELLNDHKRFVTLLDFIEKRKESGISVTGEVKFELPDEFDLILMNPPFTRATGRVGKEFKGKEKGLFGFIADESVRRKLKNKLDAIREKANKDLREMLKPQHKLSIGQAGEGALFLYLAYKYVKQGGVIGFVLPKSLLSGVSWFLLRALLVKKFHLMYVITSSEKNEYNFSESTNMSECLIVAKRVEEHNENETTLFVNLLKKPKSATEAVILTQKLVNGKLSAYDQVIVNSVKREKLLENLTNWGVFTGLITNIATRIERGEIVSVVSVPLTELNSLVTSIGVNRRGDIISAFKLPVKGTRVDCSKLLKSPNSFPMLCGSSEVTRKKMIVKPNAWVVPETEDAKKIIEKYAANVLLPNRIRWSTTHVVALFCDQSVVSNTYFMTRLKVDEERSKALTLWLNTTWGILLVLKQMEVTEGAWTSLNIAQWKSLKVLDVTKLDNDCVKRLSKVFEEFCDKEFKRIPEQFGDEPDALRLSLDLEFVKAINPSIDENKVRLELASIYKALKNELSLMTSNL